ncbi:MAG: galactosyldiacylglycerol synthase [Clostridia bacterium]|nr:galactosyldiacylglycerol synthase [Clostridia bacterium]
MKVLILTITAGEGHNSTAAAIQKDLEARGVECRTLDTCLEISRGLYNLISKGYLLTTAEFKKAYSFVYGKLENRKGNSYTGSLTRTTYGLVKKNIADYISEYCPDVIVYTHVFAGVFLDIIMQKKTITAKTVGILTDFVMHPFWEETLRTDRVVIPNEMLIPAARRKGLSDVQIVPSGIPIRSEFATAVPRDGARRLLGLDADIPTLMLMGGSMGYGSMLKTMCEIDALDAEFQIISVCGNNQKVKEEIDTYPFRRRVLNFGYTNQISLLMDAADCIVTKPGGLTTSEALAKRLPMIICNPIPGQEERNADFLLNSGVAMKITPTLRLSDAVYQMFSDPRRIECMRASTDLIRKPNAARDLTDLILSFDTGKPNA